MLFSSISFLYYFLPVMLLVYFVVPKSWKNAVLLLGSLLFYAWGEPRYVIVMLFTIVAGYGYGLLVERFRGRKEAKLILGMAVATFLGVLGYFKYANFFLENIRFLTGGTWKLLHIVLPIGISFYTFQIISYVADVYRGTVMAQRNPVTLAAYVALFPQLIAGPIVRYSDVEQQLKSREHSIDFAAEGIRRFIIGLSKKVLIANALGELCDVFVKSGDKSVGFYWLYAVAFTLHIYYDFSGYSDMAIGLGKILGFDFMENFRYPYVAKSITEFWRRWHISLGSWFRDYVYIPLGGNRVSRIKWLRNILIVWFLTGLWHGAAWNFVVWGLFYAMLLLVEKVWLYPYLEKSSVWSHVYTMFFVIMGFVIFDGTDMVNVVHTLGAMFGLSGIPFVSAEFIYYLQSYAVLLVLSVIGVTPLCRNVIKRLRKNQVWNKIINVAEVVVLTGFVLVVTAYLVDGSFNPFLYFRF